MTKTEILAALRKLEEIAYDGESAHGFEDELRGDFIRYIAERDDDLGKKARLVLSTNKIKFDRWYA